MNLRRLSVLAVRVILFRGIMRPFLSLIVGVKFPRASAFPDRQFILVSNHNSHLDTVSLLCALPVKRLMDVHPAAAADYFAKNKCQAFIFQLLLNTVFVRRKGEVSDRKPIDDLDDHIKCGKSLILFPEGTRGRPEILSDFKNGAAILMQKNPGLVYLPVLMRGMGKALPKGSQMVLPTECEILIGNTYAESNAATSTPQEITLKIRNSMLSLGKTHE